MRFAQHKSILWAALTLAVYFSSTLRAADDPPSAKDVARSLQSAFADAIERAEPSVVSVVRIRAQDPVAAESFVQPPPFRPGRGRIVGGRIVPDLQDDPSGGLMGPNFVPEDFGSGVVIDSDGLVLTNHHVVEGASKLFVVLQNGKSTEAAIAACDPRSDLAVLRVPVGKLQAITIGDASKMKKGHFVVALGNPFATARDGRASASWGIISNIARRLPPPQNVDEVTLHHSGTLFQTDARLNYGMSGGALVNLDGEMIGLTTSLAAIRGYDQAAGYAIPMDEMMRRIVAVLRDGREVEYGFLAVQPSDARANDGTTTLGAQIDEAFVGGPAYLAGIQPRDIIVAVDGKPVRNSQDLLLHVGMRFAGAKVPIAVMRDGRRLNLTVSLGKFPVKGEVRAENGRSPWRGIHVDYTTVLCRDRFRSREQLARVPDGGVLAARVETESSAAKAGLQAESIITHVNKTRVRNPDEFERAVESLEGTVELTTEAGKFTISE